MSNIDDDAELDECLSDYGVEEMDDEEEEDYDEDNIEMEDYAASTTKKNRIISELNVIGHSDIRLEEGDDNFSDSKFSPLSNEETKF